MWSSRGGGRSGAAPPDEEVGVGPSLKQGLGSLTSGHDRHNNRQRQWI
jgi:hypothetical protein